MIDNFDLIKKILNFDLPHSFYFIQIFKRRKENPDMKKDVKVIDIFYIYSMEDLDKLKNKIVELCIMNNARAYIGINRLDTEQVAIRTAQKILDCIVNKDFVNVKNAYQSVCGGYQHDPRKKWIVDIDTIALPHKDKIKQIVKELHEDMAQKYEPILMELPTRSGVHLICTPFDVNQYNKKMKEFGLKENDVELKNKNSPTILFCTTASTIGHENYGGC